MFKKIFLIAAALLLLVLQNSPCKAAQDYFEDTVWVKKTDQMEGFYQVKFSNNDSIIVAHGYQGAILYNTYTGEEIKRIPFNAEVHFFNKDKNFIQLAPSRDMLIIFDTKNFKAIDTLEYDSLSIGDIIISNDEKKVIGIVSNGLRVWNLFKHNIILTKLYKAEEYQTSLQTGQISITNDNSQFIVTERREFYFPEYPYNAFSLRHNVYDILTLDSIDTFVDKAAYRLSNTNKYIAFRRTSKDYGVEIYDYSSKELVQKLEINGYNLTGIEFSPDDKYIVTSSGPSTNALLVWSIENGEIVYNYPGGSYSNVGISKSGKYIISSTGRYLFLINFKNGTSIVENDKEKYLKTIYPNPATNTAIIEFEQKTSGNTRIELLNIQGILLKTIINKFLESGRQIIEINTSDIPSGYYYIIVQNEKEQYVFQLVVEH